MKRKKLFIYIVDSYAEEGVEKFLLGLGLKMGTDYHITGAGGATVAMQVHDFANPERLLVFMSSFHGYVEPAERLAHQIKEVNPSARMIFRSATENSSDPIFEQNIGKSAAEHNKFCAIVTEFVGVTK